MSRVKHHESLNAVQLFPFVAVLLCTMGSLLVLLVSVARSSKDQAAEEAVAAQAAARAAAVARANESRESSETNQRELEKIAKYQAEIDSVSNRATNQLREDQSRLSHLEDHMRRLRDQLESLQLAAAELNALEGEHVDDRQQAQSEIERLQQLIEESRSTIEQLRADANSRSKAYAIVPYKGRSGTYRRPIYIECRANDVVLQPEGVVFTEDDFRPPIGPGNALAAALRAAREHILQYESTATTGSEASPYPLIIVRPNGIAAYYCVREAIQSWDDEFGYELVEEDWELKYAAANPLLANKELQAAELARGRLRALAVAAPQAYGAYRSGGGFAGSGPGSDDDDGESFAGGGGGGNGRGGGGTVTVVGGGPAMAGGGSGRGEAPAGAGGGDRYATRPVTGQVYAGGENGNSAPGPSSTPTGDKTGGGTDDRYASKSPPGSGAPNSGTTPSGTTPSTGTVPPGDQTAAAGYQPPPPPGAERKPDGSPANGTYTAGDDPEQELDDLARAAAGDEDADEDCEGEPGAKQAQNKPRGKNWALANGRPGMIPIRRTIQIVVRDDALAILPESSATEEATAAGREFPFAGTPEVAYDELISAVEQRIKGWGIAGQGLYWRPVVELKISTNGDHRVDDLMRLLKHSGVEVRGSEVAQHENGGAAHANR